MTAEELIAFEDEIADLFQQGRIKAPVHLSGGNEQALIDIFKAVRPDDWILAGWRSHYACLLKGVPRGELINAILAGTSVALSFPKYNVFCSGICGGIAPIAVGIAWSLKRRDAGQFAHVFLGDMSARMGIVNEAGNYAIGHGLPVRWYCENNGKSVATSTEAAWGWRRSVCNPPMIEYRYELTRPHVGVGRWVAMDEKVA